MCAIIKSRCFNNFSINSKSKLKKDHHTIEAITKKKSLRNLTRFHDELIELEILEIFTTGFCQKLLFELEFFQVLKIALLEQKKIFSKKIQNA